MHTYTQQEVEKVIMLVAGMAYQVIDKEDAKDLLMNDVPKPLVPMILSALTTAKMMSNPGMRPFMQSCAFGYCPCKEEEKEEQEEPSPEDELIEALTTVLETLKRAKG